MNYTIETWKSGLRTIFVPMTGTQTVSVFVLVGAGSRYETKEINGISHFLEHMAFKGTVKRPDKVAIAKELDGVGAEFNAYTGQEYTGYWVKVDREHIELAVDVVSDIFLHSTLPADEIEKERGVILGEIDLQQDSPLRQAWDTFNALMLGDQPSGWTILGPKEVIRSLKRDDFFAYRDKYYKAPNVVVVVAGNIELDATKALVKDYFREVPSGETPKAEAVRWEQDAPRIEAGSTKFDQSHLMLGTWAFDYHDERRHALQILEVILGQGMSSRLFLKVREDLGLGYYVRGDTSQYNDYGFFEVRAGVDADRLEEAVGAILEELKRIKNEEVDGEELAKAFRYIKGRTLIDLEASDEVAAHFGHMALERGEILTPEEEFSKLEKVTPAEVSRVAQELFTDQLLNLAIVGPVKDVEGVRKRLTFA